MNLGFGFSHYIPYAVYFLWWIVVCISLFKCEIGIMFLIPLLPFQNLFDKLQDFAFGKDLIDILLISIMLGWLTRLVSKKDKILTHTLFNLPIFVLTVITYIGLWRGSYFLGIDIPVHASDPRVEYWKNYMIIFLIYFIVVNNIKTKKQLLILAMLMCFSILVMNRWFYSSYQWIKNIDFSYKQRMNLGYLGPNELAAFFGHNLFVLLGLFYFDKLKIRKYFLLVGVLISLYSVLHSFSRGVYLGVLVGFIVFALIENKKFLIPIVIFLIFWKSLLPISVVERIDMTVGQDIYGQSTGELEESAQERVDIWKKSLDLFKSSPLLGVGFQVIPSLGFQLKDVHNMYVSFLSELGIIGLALFLLLFLLALIISWKLFKNSNDFFFKGLGFGVFLSVISSAITNFFGNHWTYIQLGSFYWAFLAMVVRANIIERESHRNTA